MCLKEVCFERYHPCNVVVIGLCSWDMCICWCDDLLVECLFQSNQTILGVMGIDVSTKELGKRTPYLEVSAAVG